MCAPRTAGNRTEGKSKHVGLRLLYRLFYTSLDIFILFQGLCCNISPNLSSAALPFCAFPTRSASLSSSHHINIISMTISTLLYVQNTKIYHTLRSAFLDIHLSTSHSSLLLSSYLFLCQLLSYHLTQAQFKDPFTLSLHIHIILCMCLCFLILHFSYAQYDT